MKKIKNQWKKHKTLKIKPWKQTWTKAHEKTHTPLKKTQNIFQENNPHKFPCLLGPRHATGAAKNAVSERSFTSCQSSWPMASGGCSLNTVYGAYLYFPVDGEGGIGAWAPGHWFLCMTGGIRNVFMLFSMTGSSSQLYLGKCWKREMVYEVGHGWSKFCQLFIQKASFRPRIWVFCRTLWIFKPNSLFVSYNILRTYCNLQNHPFSYKAAWLAGVSNHPFETNKFIKLGIISPMFERKQKYMKPSPK